MMWFLVCSAAVVAGSLGAGAAAAPGPDSLNSLTPFELLQIDPPAQDDEGLSYAVPPMGGRYAAAPWLYLLADVPRDSQGLRERRRVRAKRPMPSLSIDQPMSVLRRKLGLEKERKLHAQRAAGNRNYLNDIGKREAVGAARGSSAAEAQDAVAVDQQPYGGAAPAADAGGGAQADARGQPAAGLLQPTLPAEHWQARISCKPCRAHKVPFCRASLQELEAQPWASS